jgi:hypothetical protein
MQAWSDLLNAHLFLDKPHIPASGGRPAVNSGDQDEHQWLRTTTAQLMASYSQQASSQHPCSSPQLVAWGAEHAALLLHSLHHGLSQQDDQIPQQMDSDELSEPLIEGPLKTRTQLDQMAADLSASAEPALFNMQVDQHSTAEQLQGRRRQQLQAVRGFMYGHLRLRHDPIEWLYDGLAPLLLPSALRLRKAPPFTLGVLATSLCTRLHVDTVLLRMSSRELFLMQSVSCCS